MTYIGRDLAREDLQSNCKVGDFIADIAWGLICTATFFALGVAIIALFG